MATKKGNSSKKKKGILRRPPIVVILGHVDHGKTTLLDYIRKTQIAAREAGGITQRIGAYQVDKPAKITFIDTPGHKAFAKMRNRGATVADIAILVVAADDSVMPQTKESVKYIKQAQIPLIVAINKMDLEGVDADRVKKDLLEINVACEGYGGEIVAIEISAKTGEGVNELLEIVGLIAEMEDLTADPNGDLNGVIIESRLDRKRGPVATVLVRNGILHKRDLIVADSVETRVKALFNEFGDPIVEAWPSEPVIVLGFSDLPSVGSIVAIQQENNMMKKRLVHQNSEQIISKKDKNIMQVVIKAESEGALESVLENIAGEVEVLLAGVGDVTESDINYAATTKAVLIGFKVKIPSGVQKTAETEGVVVRVYDVIYKLLDEIDEVVEKLKRGPEEVITGRAKVLEKFIINDVQIAGVRVEEGKFRIGDRIRVECDSSVSHGQVISIKHGKIDVKETRQGEEYGIGVTNKLDFTKKDVIIAYNITNN